MYSGILYTCASASSCAERRCAASCSATSRRICSRRSAAWMTTGREMEVHPTDASTQARLRAAPPLKYPPIGRLELSTAAADVLLFLQRLVN